MNDENLVTRRDGRVAEGARLESVYTGNRIGGSNPSLSAIQSEQQRRRPAVRRKSKEFPANSALASKPDRREWSAELVTLPFSLLFSAGPIGSPVLKIRLGECWAIWHTYFN